MTAFQEELTIKKEDRPKIRAWFERWLVNAATQRPGKWAEQFRPKLLALAETIDLELDKNRGKFKVVCGSADSDALAYLTRGTMWFDGIDRIEAELVRVISTANLNSEP